MVDDMNVKEGEYPMAMNLIENISLCRLGGFVGSNPEVLGSILPISNTEEKALLDKALPHGIEPPKFVLERLNNKYILSYIFSMKAMEAGVRNDLASITLLIPADKKVNIDDFQVLFKLVIESFKADIDKVDVSKLKYMIERIYNGINKGEKIAVENVDVDVPSIVKSKKLRLVTETEKVAGRIF
ncbi:MAG: hypothetical protein GYA24_25705 [Candidatus Lokiarchaeota archaeon]|nr:hypothetical protein [Candidatus Lokiarchaeota archaeon]